MARTRGYANWSSTLDLRHLRCAGYSGGSKDLSSLTQRDPVPPSQSIIQELPKAPSQTKRARSQTTSGSPQRGCQLGTYSLKPARFMTTGRASPKRTQDKPLSVQPQDLAALKNDLAAMMKDMIKSTLTDLGVAPNPLPQKPLRKEPSQDSEESSEEEENSHQAELLLDQM